ncbi:AmiS/UreI family transporter [Bacillus norwichensis]|uniref:Transporter n=1 Tax=Bacillus norwichensis TaxID=2762217 RepID=A0ABR8VMY1_9BACI|nr:AmiS/UreI family transporter [Bacillus norwichensis]MBD8006110.1 transporter [Bacillus norwichensis]
MSNVGLLYVGGVLFINSLMLLGRIDGKSASVFNIFIGILQVFTPIYLIIKADGNMSEIMGAASIFLFGFTYLYVGLTNWFGLETSGLGWYCLWVAILALGFSYISFSNADIKFGIIWLFWSYLWFLFYLVLAKNMDIGRYVGKVTFVMAWITCTIPAFLGLAELWDQLSNTIVLIVAGLAVIYFLASYFSERQASSIPKNVTS